MADNRKYIQAQKFRLSGSGVSATDTSLTLRSFKYPDGATNIVTADIGSITYGTLEPGTSREEIISFTTITQNADGTATLSGITRGLKFYAPYDQDTALRKSHSGNAIFILTNNPQMYDGFTNKNDDETIAGIWIFANASMPRADSAVTYGAGTEEYFATKRYVDSVVTGGAADASTTAKGLAEEATQAEVDARTAAGSVARLFVNPSSLRAVLMHDYAADAGANDAYAITLTPAPTAYTTGDVYIFKANTVNTGACTLNVNALGAKSLKMNKDIDPVDGYIKAGAVVVCVYDGTNMQIISVSGKPNISQDGSQIYAADSVGTDAYAITLAPAIAAYTTGQVINFKAGTANTGASTLAINGLTAKSIVKRFNVALETGDIVAGQIVQVVYDSVGDNFQMLSAVAKAPPSLGAHVSRTWGTIYQATTDCFVVAYFTGDGGAGVTANIVSDASATPTTVRAYFRASGSGYTGTMMWPVRAGHYYQVATVANTPTGTVVYEVPLS